MTEIANPKSVRPETLNHKRGENVRIGRLLYPESFERPRTRADCVDGPRPCPFVGCRYHLYVDEATSGGLKFNFPELESWDLPWSCALDIADAGGTTLEAVGRIMNLTRERVRQIEVDALDLASAELGRLGFGLLELLPLVPS